MPPTDTTELKQWVYSFSQADPARRDLLGGKGAELAQMTSLGLPIPPGFTITTDMCTRYYQDGGVYPDSLRDEVARFEEGLIRSTLLRQNGRKSATARALGITREGLYKKMKRLGIG